jgi:hypothetical protein
MPSEGFLHNVLSLVHVSLSGTQLVSARVNQVENWAQPSNVFNFLVAACFRVTGDGGPN